MDFSALFREIGKNMQRWCGEWWAGVFIQTRQSRTGEGISTLDSATMSDETADAPGAEIDCTRMEMFGDITLAPTDTNCIVMRKADGALIFPMGQPASRPTDAKVGDRGLYSSKAGTRVHLYGEGSGEPGAILITQASGARVKIEQDGSVKVDSASGKNIVLNGGTQDNARKNDGVQAGILKIKNESDGGMPPKDVVTVYFHSTDPQDPAYGTDVMILKFKLTAGDAIFPISGNTVDTSLTGIITRGRDNVKS